MTKKVLVAIILCMSIAFSVTGCKSESAVAVADGKNEQEASETDESSSKSESSATSVTINSDKKPVQDTKTDQKLYDEFLKDRAEVHFNKYQPEKYYELNEYMFEKNDTATLSELLAVYDKYYLEELTYTELYKNIGYTYIDAGDAGRQQLVVECGFAQGSGAQFIIGQENGQLEMLYVIDSRERVYGTVANKYGLITTTGSSSYAEYDVDNQYIDENGTVHNIYVEAANYNFGQDAGYGDPLLDTAEEFRNKEGFKDDVILRTYAFEEYRSDFTKEEEEAYYNNMLYTVEYVTDEEIWHEDAMYAEGSIFNRIFEKAGRKLSTPEEIAEAITKREEELNMPEKARKEDPVILTDFTDKEKGAVLGADVTDGKSDLEHALTAYAKFLKNPVNMCEILTTQTLSPYGSAQPGMIFGFALRDFNEDNIPELVIDFGQPAFPLSQMIYIYSYYKEDGMVRRTFKMDRPVNGEYGLEYQKETMNESYLMEFNEKQEKRMAECPDYKDALLYVKFRGAHLVGTYGRYLVAFDADVEEEVYKSLLLYDLVEDDVQSYTEYLAYMDDYLDFTTDESMLEDPEEIMYKYKPILFYDITDENIDKILSEDYWNENSGENAFSDYYPETVYDFLTERAKWYYDLGIMDDDDTYDSIECYDYDEDTGVHTTIYFDLDKRIQSRFKLEDY